MADEIVIAVRAEDNFSSVLGNFGSIITGVESVVNLAAEAFNMAADFIGDFVNSAAESEVAVTKLNTVLASTNNTFGLTSSQLQDMATSMMNLSGFSDEAEMSAQAMLLRFENLNGIFPQALQLTNDLAVSLGIDLTSAAQTIGKALDDPASGIGRLNTQFKLFNETEMETIKQMATNGDIAGAQALIMERLTQKVGGAASAYGDTFSGSLAIANEQLDNLKEMIGAAFLPVFSQFLDMFEQSLPILQNFASAIATAISSGDFSQLAQMFEGIFANIDFSGLVQSIGDFLANIDWNAVGNNIATGINNIDWVAVGNAIKQGLIIASVGLDFVITNIIGRAIQNINWGNIAHALGNAVTGIIAGAFGYVDWDALMVDFKNGFVYIGQQALEGLASAFGYTHWANLVNDFKNGLNYLVSQIKSFLGIASPSTLFMSIGHDIVQGLINGWNSLFSTFSSLITSGIEAILALFAPFLALFGIDVDTTTTGTGSGTGTGTGSGAQTVNNYFYGPVYIGTEGDLNNGNYDCPSPNPLVASSGNQLVTSGF